MQNVALRRPVVLLVEDEPIVLEVVALELQDWGFEVLRALSGEEAARQLDAGAQIDLLLTDIQLPGEMDGWAVAERARERRAGVPVIYATGSFEDDPRRVAGSLIIAKPYRTANLIDAASRLGVTAD
jgi:CheY-like chemotaxis protein